MENNEAVLKNAPKVGEKTNITNTLINGRWDLTVQEARMLMGLIASLKGDGSGLYRIRAKELGQYMNLKGESIYDTIKKTAKKLQARTLFFESEDGSWVSAGWVASISYNKSSSEVIYEFSRKIEPLLLDFSRGYIKAITSDLMPFRHTYSMRLYMLCKEWHEIYKGKPKIISIDELREMFQLQDKYKTARDFNNFVIQLSIEEINLYTNLSVKANPIKEGRSYKQIEFVIRAKTQVNKTIETVALSADWNDEQSKIYNELVNYGLNGKQGKFIVNSFGVAQIKSNIDYTLQQKERNKIKGSFEAYLYSAVTSDYAGNIARIAAREASLATEKEQHKIDNMSPEAREEYLEQKTWFAEQSKIAENAKNPYVDTAQAEKDKIKQEFFLRTTVEQEHFVMSIKDSLEKEPSPFVKMHYQSLIIKSFGEIVLDDRCLDLLAQYILRTRNLELDPDKTSRN